MVRQNSCLAATLKKVFKSPVFERPYLEAISQWKNLDEHKMAQQLGRDSFYEEYAIQVCEVLRDYGFEA